MLTSTRQPVILFLSTYPPRKCGIASFTQDLVTAIKDEIEDDMAIQICALDKNRMLGLYDQSVSMTMNGYDNESCMETAALINKSESIKLVCIEHEFGLYGGQMGEYLLGFLALIDKPFIIRFHTVLPAPDEKRLKIVQTIGLLAEKVIVMTNHAASLLQNDYHFSPEKITIIPHGTHKTPGASPSLLKLKYDLHEKLVLTTFGLLSPNKGIEKAILAMKAISAEIPNSMYLLIGQTHPNLLETEGEKYREYLQQLVDENGLQQNVRIVNEYVPTDILMEYLALTDIYLFTSKDPNQAMSGTFLYAMSAGCAIISNSFVLAKEMLDEETGIILQTNDEEELATHAIRLLKNDLLRKNMAHNAYLRTRNTAWKKVAGKHMDLFAGIVHQDKMVTTHAKQFII
jgi:glycosyltransferase involved in cell wall biosynthesis